MRIRPTPMELLGGAIIAIFVLQLIPFLERSFKVPPTRIEHQAIQEAVKQLNRDEQTRHEELLEALKVLAQSEYGKD